MLTTCGVWKLEGLERALATLGLHSLSIGSDDIG